MLNNFVLNKLIPSFCALSACVLQRGNEKSPIRSGAEIVKGKDVDSGRNTLE